MAFHCGAPTRDGSPCQRHVRELGIRCPQHRNLGGPALHPPRHAMRTIELADPALTAARTPWTSARADLMARAGELRDRVTPDAEQESPDAPAGTPPTEDDGADATDPATGPGPVGARSYLDRERSRRVRAEAGDEREAADGEPETAGGEREAARDERETARDKPETAGAKPEAAGDQRKAADGEPEAGRTEGDAGAEPEREAGQKAAGEVAADREQAEAEPEADRPSALLSYLDRERARRLKAEAEAEPEPEAAEPLTALSYIARQRAAESEPDSDESDQASEPGSESAPEPESRPVEQRPQLRKERALDPDWINARPLFRDEAPTRPLPKIEFEPSEARPPRKPPRVPPMRSVVLNPTSEASQPAVTPNGFAAEPDPPTLIDRMPPIDHDDLVVPEFLRPDFGAPAAAPERRDTPPPLPQRTPRPWPIPKGPRKPKADPDPPTLIDPHPPIAAEDAAAPATPAAPAARVASAPAPVATAKPAAAGARAAATAKPAATAPPITRAEPATAASRPAPAAAAAAPASPPAAAAATPAAAPTAPDDISVPDFIVPGFTQPAKPPLRTVLSTVLGPDLWQRCYVEWSPAHCTALARIARTVDGLAPSAGTAVRSTAGAGMRWLGMAREREQLADQVAAAISHPVGATAPNQARTVRLYGAAICMALNIPLRRCACHRDLDRDVSGELIRLGLEELAGEVT